MTILLAKILVRHLIPGCTSKGFISLIHNQTREILVRKEVNYIRQTKFKKAMSSMDAAHFRGALVGALIGDCLGAPFEADHQNLMLDVKDVIKFVEDIKGTPQGRHIFTDDTAMLRSIAKSLIAEGKVDAKDLAKRFSEEYFNEPNRGYGSNVVNVFTQLRDEKYEDPYGPAARQYHGKGSKGNGGGMRIAPAALFGFNFSENNILRLVRDITKITHTHPDAVNGAILQCLAVHHALKIGPSQQSTKLIAMEFVDLLHAKMKNIETIDSVTNEQPYCNRLMKIKDYLRMSADGDSPSRDVIREHLGNNVTALGSVPSAVYSFLRCFQPVSDIPDKFGAFERTIIYAISLGGDTDTIATMAGAIAGAYYGIDCVPENWRNSCEGLDNAIHLADGLLQFAKGTSK